MFGPKEAARNSGIRRTKLTQKMAQLFQKLVVGPLVAWQKARVTAAFESLDDRALAAAWISRQEIPRVVAALYAPARENERNYRRSR